MVNLGCQLDWIWNQLLDMPLGVSVKTFFGRKPRGNVPPQNEQHPQVAANMSVIKKQQQQKSEENARKSG